MDVLVSRRYVPKLSLRVFTPSQVGRFRVPGSWSHLVVKALLADRLVPQGAAPLLLHLLSEREVTPEVVASVLPEPYWGLGAYLYQFFWVEDEMCYTCVPGLENTSLVSLLSLAGEGYLVFSYSSNLDLGLLESVDHALRGRGLEILLKVDRIDYAAQRLLRRAGRIYVGRDVDSSTLAGIKASKVASPRALERVTEGTVIEGNTVTRLDSWAEIKSAEKLVIRRREIDLLAVFGEDREKILSLLDEVLKSGSANENAVADWARAIGLDSYVYYDLVRYGFLELTPAGIVRLTVKGYEALRREKEQFEGEGEEGSGGG